MEDTMSLSFLEMAKTINSGEMSREEIGTYVLVNAFDNDKANITNAKKGDVTVKTVAEGLTANGFSISPSSLGRYIDVTLQDAHLEKTAGALPYSVKVSLLSVKDERRKLLLARKYIRDGMTSTEFRLYCRGLGLIGERSGAEDGFSKRGKDISRRSSVTIKKGSKVRVGNVVSPVMHVTEEQPTPVQIHGNVRTPKLHDSQAVAASKGASREAVANLIESATETGVREMQLAIPINGYVATIVLRKMTA